MKNLFDGVLIVVVVFVAVVTIGFAVFAVNLSMTCASHGYPDSMFSWHEAWCVKSVNGTDVVVPLSQLGEGR